MEKDRRFYFRQKPHSCSASLGRRVLLLEADMMEECDFKSESRSIVDNPCYCAKLVLGFLNT